MHVTIKGRRGTYNFNVSYTIGDIVRVERPGCCLANTAFKSIFGLEDVIPFPKVDDIWGAPYPKLEGNTDEWKIIDFKAYYESGFAILLRNRFKQCVVMSQSDSVDGETLKVVRKNKKRINALELEVV